MEVTSTYSEGLVASPGNAPQPKFSRSYGIVGAAIIVSVMVMGAVVADTSSSSSPSSVLQEGGGAAPTNVMLAMTAVNQPTGKDGPRSASPDFSLHRKMLGWSDADIDQFWKDASDWYEETWGIPDAESWQIVDPATGARISPDGALSLTPMLLKSGIEADYFYSTPPIDTPDVSPDDPAPITAEVFIMKRLTPGGFYEKFGIDAQVNDLLIYGHIFLDLYRNGDPWISLQCGSDIPYRFNPDLPGDVVNGVYLKHPDWGAGQLHAAIFFTPTEDDGEMAVSISAIWRFPRTTNFGKIEIQV